MSKSRIKIKIVLTMIDMTESTELLPFKRQKDGYKVIVKISVLFYLETNPKLSKMLASYEIYMVCLIVATVYWDKSLQFAKKIRFSPCLFMILSAVSMVPLCSTTFLLY